MHNLSFDCKHVENDPLNIDYFCIFYRNIRIVQHWLFDERAISVDKIVFANMIYRKYRIWYLSFVHCHAHFVCADSNVQSNCTHRIDNFSHHYAPVDDGRGGDLF